MPVSMISAMQSHLGMQDKRALGPAAERTGRTAHIVKDEVDLSVKTAQGHQNRQTHDILNEKAGHIRSLDAGLQRVKGHVRKMTDDIQAFKKNFPPFPTGSEERVRLLNSFSAIRKQIARLTLPPEAAEKAVSEQTALPEASKMSFTVVFEELFAAIWDQLPAVPADTSDSAFEALKKKLESLLDFIQKKRDNARQQMFPVNGFAADSSMGMSFEMTGVSVTIGTLFSEQPAWQMTVSQVSLKVF